MWGWGGLGGGAGRGVLCVGGWVMLGAVGRRSCVGLWTCFALYAPRGVCTASLPCFVHCTRAADDAAAMHTSCRLMIPAARRRRGCCCCVPAGGLPARRAMRRRLCTCVCACAPPACFGRRGWVAETPRGAFLLRAASQRLGFSHATCIAAWAQLRASCRRLAFNRALLGQPGPPAAGSCGGAGRAACQPAPRCIRPCSVGSRQQAP